jgi:hypothetical protein
MKEWLKDILLQIRNSLMQDIGGQFYSRILMTFTKVVIAIKKLEDSKQRIWIGW